MSGESMRRSALAYADAGLAVFPVRTRDKRPALSGWQRFATTDPEVIRDFWPEDSSANVGVRCGHGLVVLDADSADAVARLRDLDLPATPSVRTARGLHVYLRGSAETRVRLLPGLDVRGTGGYVVGAGSVHPDGHVYRWETPPDAAPLARIPDRLQDLLVRKDARHEAQRAENTRGQATRSEARHGPIPQGARNVTLTSKAGSLHRAGLSVPSISAALHAENQERARPPLATDEVDRIVASISKTKEAPPWVTNQVRFANDLRLDHRARLVLIVLCSHASDQGRVRGGTWLSEKTGLPRNQITKAVKTLEAAGRLRVDRRPRRASVYTIVADAVPSKAFSSVGSGSSCTHTVQEGAA